MPYFHEELIKAHILEKKIKLIARFLEKKIIEAENLLVLVENYKKIAKFITAELAKLLIRENLTRVRQT